MHGTKILSFSKNSKFCKQEVYKNDHIIDIHIETFSLVSSRHTPDNDNKCMRIEFRTTKHVINKGNSRYC